MNYTSGVNTAYARNIKFYNITNSGQAAMFSNRETGVSSTAMANFNDVSTVGITDGLIGYWPLSGNTKDYSGFNRHGSASGATSQGNSYYFDGVNDTINFGTGDTFFPLKRHTISIMFASDGTTATTGTYPCLFGFTYGIRGLLGDSGTPEYALTKTNGNTYVSSGVSGLHDSQWHLFTATCDGGIIRIYVDGIYKNQGSVATF
jgi:hypothetical protein